MKVLVVGGGGREHAIVWKLSQSPKVDKLYCAPGNGGIAALAECVPIPASDADALTMWAKREEMDFVVIGPDDPLAAGLADVMTEAGLTVFGPSQKAARIESSKIFSKTLMKKYGIPTAGWEAFTEAEEALAYIRRQAKPLVVKADGLALGKGVVVADTVSQAEDAVRDMMTNGRFSEAGRRVVIEERMTGPEVTVLAFCDGKTLKVMPPSQDHKRLGEGDTGPNTGGMGAISPVSSYTEDIAADCMERIFLPTVRAMEAEGCPFKGVLYFGLMLTPDGPRVVEYNARFGDPEAQAVLLRLKTDLMEVMEAVAAGRLDTLDIEWSEESACAVVLASGGYPGAYETGKAIGGWENVPENVYVFHAGTVRKDEGFFTSGGRVLAVAALGESVGDALRRAYAGAERITFENKVFRRDIGGKDEFA